MEDRSKEEIKLRCSIGRKFNKAIREYGLIRENDHILIGLSGGKDSLVLTELIGEKMKIFSPRFTATAVHVTVENIGYQSDLDYLSSYAASYGIPFIHRNIRYEEKPDQKKPVCFLCSWNRRKALFEAAKELGCHKIALGHHLDDTVETLLLNMCFQGAFGTMPPLLQMNKFDMSIIRPMSLISEKEIVHLTRFRSYPEQLKKCPFEKESFRQKMKTFVSELEKLNPEVRQSIFAAMQNIQKEYLPRKTDRN